MKKMYFALLMLGLVLTSCGASPEGRADDLCDCFKDAGIDFDGIKSERDLDELQRKIKKLSSKKEKEAKECVFEVMEGVKSDVKDMDDDEIAEYMRDFAKAGIDTECAVEAMEDLPYDDMKDLLDEMVDGMEDEIEKD